MGIINKIERTIIAPFLGGTNKNYYYYRGYDEGTLKKYESVEYYLNLFERCACGNNVNTKEPIQYSEDIDFGEDFETIKSIKSNNRYKEDPNNYSILLCRTKIGGLRAKSIMCFYKNKLFFFNYIFNIRESQKSKVLGILQEKYLNGALLIDYNNQNIIDENNNYILIEDDVSLIINYVSYKKEIHSSLKLALEVGIGSKKHKEEMEKKELYNRL